MSQDVAAFLMWAAEPKMMARKAAGPDRGAVPDRALTVLLCFTNKKIWAPHKGKPPRLSPARGPPPATAVARVLEVCREASTSPGARRDRRRRGAG